MQTHTFIADTARDAVEQIRAQLGPSAVVLSVRQLPRNGLSRLVRSGHIEVVATVGQAPPEEPSGPINELQDEVRALKQQFAAMRAQSSAAQPPRALVSAGSPSALSEFLTRTGLLPGFSEQISETIVPPGEQRERLTGAQEFLRSRWQQPASSETAVHLFVGVPGAGKSTVLCKVLAQTTLVEQRPAVVYQLDSHIANPPGQATIFAEITGARFERTLPENFECCEGAVFIDIPGVALGNEKGLTALSSVIEAFGMMEIHLVLNGAYDSSLLLSQVEFFANLGITDLVVTHLDEEFRWGKLWNLVLGTNYSVRWLSGGQNVPGNLIVPTADLILERQFCGNQVIS